MSSTIITRQCRNLHAAPMRQLICIGRTYPQKQGSSIMCLTNSSMLSKYPTLRMYLQQSSVRHSNVASKQLHIRQMSNSINPESSTHKSTVHLFSRPIYEELKYLFNSIRQHTLRDIISRILSFSTFIGICHMITEYGLRTFTCEGPSMEPTIIDGSFTLVLVERWSHRLFGLESDYDIDSVMHQSSNLSNGATEENNTLQEKWLTMLRGIWKQHFTSGLQRGDVIILNHPLREGTLCKRIIGMPGDIIVRKDGGSEETNHRVAVPSGHFWVEGDNSCESIDSRSYGAIPASLTVGKVICRLWPLREYTWLSRDTNGMDRWRRIGARIGRGDRPMPADESRFRGSYVLGTSR